MIRMTGENRYEILDNMYSFDGWVQICDTHVSGEAMCDEDIKQKLNAYERRVKELEDRLFEAINVIGDAISIALNDDDISEVQAIYDEMQTAQ